MSTITVYPDPSTGATTVDGFTERAGVDETLAAIRAGAGTAVNNTVAASNITALVASTTNNQFSQQIRGFFLFDTSAIPDTDTISSAILSLYGTGKSNSLGSPDLHIASSTPASNNILVAADYTQVGTTSFGSVPYASYNTAAYNDVTLNASGLANISKTGVSKFSTQTNWDVNNSFTGAWASGAASAFTAKYADTVGTTDDPKLVITHQALVAQTKVLVYNINNYVAQTITLVYHILNYIAKTKALVYHILNYVSDSVTFLYNIGGVIFKTLTTPYHIYNYVGKQKSLVYHILSLLPKALTLIYTILSTSFSDKPKSMGASELKPKQSSADELKPMHMSTRKVRD